MSKHARTFAGLLAGFAIMLSALPASAQDKVKVGVFPVSSSLPYFVALEKGYFKEQNIEPETVRLIGGPPNVAAMIGNQIDAAAVLVTIEGINANIKKPGVAMYISINSQNKKYQMEQFVVRKGLEAKSLADLKGKKIMSAPGPANVTMAKAALAAAGLKEGDYTIDQLDMGQHVNAMTAGTFDAGYTLEPNASTMRKLGVATTLEAGVIAHYVLGDPNANAFVGGAALTSRLHQEPAGCRQALHRGLGQGGRLDQQQPRRGAQAPPQEHVHAGRRRRYRADDPLFHGQGPDGKGQGRLSEVHRLLGEERDARESVDVTDYLKAF